MRLLLFVAGAGLVASACGASTPSPSSLSEQSASPSGQLHGTPVLETNELSTTPQIIADVAGSVSTTTWPRLPDPGEWDGKCVGKNAGVLCLKGDPKGVGTILIVGDSYAGMWWPAISIRAMEMGRKVELMELQACPWPDFPSWSLTLKRVYTECDAFRLAVVERVKETHPEVVVLASAYQGISMARAGKPTKDGLEEAWIAGLHKMIVRLSDAGAGRVIVMGDIATSMGDPLDCLSSHADNVPACNTPRDQAVVADHNSAEELAVKQDGATYVPVVPWLCTDSICPEVIAGITVRKDRWHLSLNYTLWLRRALAEAMGL